MTTIYDMASGTEYLGEELSSPKPFVVRKPAAPQIGDGYQVELRLEMPESAPAEVTAPTYPAGLNLKALIDTLED